MKTILVALDSSQRAPGVLREAAGLAKTLDGTLILLRVVGLPSELPPEAYAMSPDGVTNVLLQRARKDLDDIANGLPAGLRVEVQVAVGVPWQVICEAGKASSASLIVIGSHGYSGMDRVLGTTAARVVNHADRSVLVVREPKHAEERTSP